MIKVSQYAQETHQDRDEIPSRINEECHISKVHGGMDRPLGSEVIFPPLKLMSTSAKRIVKHGIGLT